MDWIGQKGLNKNRNYLSYRQVSKELGYYRFQNLKSNDLDIIKVPESRDEIVGISTIF